MTGGRRRPSVLKLGPCAFVAENVTGLLDVKFNDYVGDVILRPLASRYHIVKFRLSAPDFGVPQVRKRVFFVGFRSGKAACAFRVPSPTHGRGDDLSVQDCAVLQGFPEDCSKRPFKMTGARWRGYAEQPAHSETVLRVGGCSRAPAGRQAPHAVHSSRNARAPEKRG